MQVKDSSSSVIAIRRAARTGSPLLIEKLEMGSPREDEVLVRLIIKMVGAEGLEPPTYSV